LLWQLVVLTLFLALLPIINWIEAFNNLDVEQNIGFVNLPRMVQKRPQQ